MADERHHSPPSTLAEALAQKPFLKIGEAAKLVGVKPHVLRYWETEFPTLKPKKNPSGQRIYAREDIETIVEIQNLLYNKRYTVVGAKRLLARQGEEVGGEVSLATREVGFTQELASLKECIREVLRLLERMPSS